MEDTFSLLHSLALHSALLLSFPSTSRCPSGLLLLLLLSQAVLVWQLRLWTSGKVYGGFVLFVAVDVFEVDHHVQGVR